MSRVRILGIGSPSGDDQAGWLTIDALKTCDVQGSNEVAIEKLDRPGTNLIPLLENTSWVILIDAMQGGGQPGQIKRFAEDEWPDFSQVFSSHGLGVLHALSLARELGSLPPRLDLYGIEIGLALLGNEPGGATQAAARRLARVINAELDNSLSISADYPEF